MSNSLYILWLNIGDSHTNLRPQVNHTQELQHHKYCIEVRLNIGCAGYCIKRVTSLAAILFLHFGYDSF